MQHHINMFISNTLRYVASYFCFQLFRNAREKSMINTTLEKEMLYYFGQLSAEDKREMIEFTKIKARKYKK